MRECEMRNKKQRDQRMGGEKGREGMRELEKLRIEGRQNESEWRGGEYERMNECKNREIQ